MSLTEELRKILQILDQNPALIGERSLQTKKKALEKSASAFLKSIRPFKDIPWADYLELKNAFAQLKKADLPRVNAFLKEHGVEIETTTSGKMNKEAFLLEAARRRLAHAIISELRKKPDDKYVEHLLYISAMNEGQIRKFLNDTYSDVELKRFLKVNRIVMGKNGRVFDREQTLSNVIRKASEIRARVGSSVPGKAGG